MKPLWWWLTLTVVATARPSPDTIFRHWKSGPGGAVGVVRGGKLIFQRGYGLSDLKRHQANTPLSNYDLASVSKQFTATCVLILAQEGKLRLSDPLGKFVPKLPSYAARVPLRNLLNMTSGLPEYDDSQALDIQATLQGSQPSFAVGQRYEYLNFNYALLTRVVERSSGQPLGQFLSARILGPLHMSRSTFLQRPGQVVQGRATGYAHGDRGWEISRNDVPGIGDGNLFSNVQDLSRWAADWLAGSSLLRSDWVERAWTSGKTSDGEETGYGFGFEIDRHIGQRRISHNGSWMGTSTYISLYPKADLGVIVLSNREDEDVYSLGESLEDLYLGDQTSNSPGAR